MDSVSQDVHSRRELAGRRAVVTGASRGIGQAIAVRLAESGAHVICVSTRSGGCDATVDTIRSAGGAAESAVVDVADEASVSARLFDEACDLISVAL